MSSPSPRSAGESFPAAGGVATHLLTEQELAAYARDGFIVPSFRFSEDETARLRTLIQDLAADNPRYADYLMQSPHVPGNGVQGLKTSPGWMEFAAHPALLDIVEQIMGPDIILRGTAAFYKRVGTGPATAWHRDASNLPIKPLRSTHVWIAACDTYVENACLRFIPGSHKAGVEGRHIIREYEFHHADGSVGPALEPGEYDASGAIDLEMKAGEIVLFDVFTIHASRPNLGTRERVSYALRYMPGASRYDHDATSSELSSKGYSHHLRPLMLLRGENRAGNDLKRGHPQQSN